MTDFGSNAQYSQFVSKPFSCLPVLSTGKEVKREITARTPPDFRQNGDKQIPVPEEAHVLVREQPRPVERLVCVGWDSDFLPACMHGSKWQSEVRSLSNWNEK
jgi:hypothetical protein